MKYFENEDPFLRNSLLKMHPFGRHILSAIKVEYLPSPGERTQDILALDEIET